MTDLEAREVMILHLQSVIRKNNDSTFLDLFKISLNGVLSAYGQEKMRGMNATAWVDDAYDIAKAAMEKFK